MIDSKWDYPSMSGCAMRLDELRNASNANRTAMDAAMETLAAGSQSETGKAFITAYSDHVSSIAMFSEVLGSEAELLRSNINAMQEADEEIAAQIRATFGK